MQIGSRGLAAGARAYLVKPNDLDRVEGVIRTLIAEVGVGAPPS